MFRLLIWSKAANDFHLLYNSLWYVILVEVIMKKQTRNEKKSCKHHVDRNNNGRKQEEPKDKRTRDELTQRTTTNARPTKGNYSSWQEEPSNLALFDSLPDQGDHDEGDCPWGRPRWWAHCPVTVGYVSRQWEGPVLISQTLIAAMAVAHSSSTQQICLHSSTFPLLVFFFFQIWSASASWLNNRAIPRFWKEWSIHSYKIVHYIGRNQQWTVDESKQHHEADNKRCWSFVRFCAGPGLA